MKRLIVLLSLMLFFVSVFAQKDCEKQERSLIGQKVQEIVVEKWLDCGYTSKRNFTLIDFLDPNDLLNTTKIAKLNELSKKFAWKANVVTLASVPEDVMLAVNPSNKKFFIRAIDTKRVLVKQLGIENLPHAILIDELGIIRWEGELKDLTIQAMGDTLYEYKLDGKPYLNQKAPELVVEKWLTDKPDLSGKFILIDFWATTCATCVQGIPDMNEYSKRFKDDLIVIGMTNEREEKVRSMKEPVIEYYIASDTKMNMMRALEIRGIPYAILIDPQGVVRWEGWPGKKGHELTAEKIENIIKTMRINKQDADLKRDTIKKRIFLELLQYEESTKEEKDEGMWWAKSVLNQEFSIVVDSWISKEPKIEGKFRVVEFWATWCGPCKRSIPHLNELSKKFKKDIVFIGVTDESPAQVKTMKEPVIEYYSASAPKNEMYKTLNMKAVPHTLVINPKGIVCWEGGPENLTEELLKEMIRKYKK